jgi:regulator of replication initiation timing
MDEQTEEEYGYEAQDLSHEAQREQIITDLQRDNAALRAENERLRRQLGLGYENFKAWYGMAKKKHSICMGASERYAYFQILQALSGK